MIYFIIVLSILVIVLSYTTVTLYKKNERLTAMLNDLLDMEDHVSDMINNLVETYVKVLTQLKRIDKLGSFESDDEVGFVFQTIKNTIADLVEFLQYLKQSVNETDKNEGN